MHADALADGARVLIHDDLLATGGTARALAELVEGLGGSGRRASRSWSSSAFLEGRRRLEGFDVCALVALRDERLTRWNHTCAGRSRTVAAPVRRRLADRPRSLPPAALVAAHAARGGCELGRLDVGAAYRQGPLRAGGLPRGGLQGGRSPAVGARGHGDAVREAVPRGGLRGHAGARRRRHRGRHRGASEAGRVGALRRNDAATGRAQRQLDEALDGLAGLLEAEA